VLGTWQTINLNIVGCAVSAVSFASFRTWELQVPTEKPKRLGKWLWQDSKTGGDGRRYDEPHI